MTAGELEGAQGDQHGQRQMERESPDCPSPLPSQDEARGDEEEEDEGEEDGGEAEGDSDGRKFDIIEFQAALDKEVPPPDASRELLFWEIPFYPLKELGFFHWQTPHLGLCIGNRSFKPVVSSWPFAFVAAPRKVQTATHRNFDEKDHHGPADHIEGNEIILRDQEVPSAKTKACAATAYILPLDQANRASDSCYWHSCCINPHRR